MPHPRSVPSIDALRHTDGFDEIYRALHNGIHYVVASQVHGDVAEFGTSSGRTAMTLAKALADFGNAYSRDDKLAGIAPRRLLLFDGFEGFPPAMHPIDQDAPHIQCGTWGVGVTKDIGPDVLLDMCGHYFDKNRVEIHAGWYSETMPKVQPGLKLAFAHIDCDFYQSTIEVLDRLFAIDAFSDGCALYFDDWYCNRGNPKWGEQRAWAEMVAKYKPAFTDWGPYATVGHRFIIHR